jgi:diguanylate cyclase (GGDEF)-like protein/PAS domain S-box-containing protein
MSKINQRQNFATSIVKVPADQFRVIFNAAPVPLVEGLWGKKFEVRHVNSCALELFGAKTTEEFGRAFSDIIAKVPNSVLLELLSARVKGDFYEAELRLPTIKRKHISVFMRLAYMPAEHAAGHQHVILVFHDITQRKNSENFLKKLSQLDGLTKVFNHRTIVERLEQELERAKRYQLDLSCAIIDLDNFKQVNDNFGHLLGDKCLKGLVTGLKSCLRKTDIIGRYGGDEFLAILTETRPDQAVVPMERFLKSSFAGCHMQRKNLDVRVTFSVGISGFPMSGLETARDLIKAADKALYMSKSSGGHCYHLYQKTLSPAVH